MGVPEDGVDPWVPSVSIPREEMLTGSPLDRILISDRGNHPPMIPNKNEWSTKSEQPLELQSELNNQLTAQPTGVGVFLAVAAIDDNNNNNNTNDDND